MASPTLSDEVLKQLQKRREKAGLPAPYLNQTDYGPDVLAPVTAEEKTAAQAPAPIDDRSMLERARDVFNHSIEKQGGWGMNQDNLEFITPGKDIPVLGTINRGITSAVNTAVKGVQAVGAAAETGAVALDDAARATGLDEKLSVGGNKFLPGSAFMALTEAFPAAGMENGIMHVPTPQFNAYVENLIRSGKATREGLDEIAEATGRQKFGPELDEVLKNSDKPLQVKAAADDTYDLDRVAANPPLPEETTYYPPQVPAPHPDDANIIVPRPEPGAGLNDRDYARLVQQERAAKAAADEEAFLAGEGPDPEGWGTFQQVEQQPQAKLPDEPTPPVQLADRSKTQDQIGQDALALGIEPNQMPTKGRIRQDLPAIVNRGNQLTNESATAYSEAVAKNGVSSKEADQAMKRLFANLNTHGENATKIGQGLRQFKDGFTADDAKRLTDLMTDPHQQQKWFELVEKYQGDPKMLKKILRDSVDPDIFDKVLSLRYNMMLSGLKTHVYNIAGTAGNFGWDLVEHGLAGVLGKGRQLFGGDVDRITGRELGARLEGAIAGARAGLDTARQAFREGAPLDDTSRAEGRASRTGQWELPVKAMAAEDEFFRSMTATSETYGAAVRQAQKEGLTGNQLQERITQLIENPTDEMKKNTIDYGKRIRFQDDPSWIGGAIERAKTAGAKDGKLTKMGKTGVALLFPFVRTPDSLIRTAGRRSPLGVFSKTNIEDFKAGGARRDLAVARVGAGSAVAAMVAKMAYDGLITGQGPGNYEKKQALQLDDGEGGKWQENSIKIGKNYYSYAGAEPLSLTLGSIATMFDRAQETSGKDFVTQATRQIANFAEYMKDSAYLSTLSDFFAALDESRKGGAATPALASFLGNLGQSFIVPAAVRQVNQSYIDPVSRDTRGDDSIGDRVIGRIQTGIPGLSDNLPAQVDALGDEVGKGDALGPDLLSRMSAPSGETSAVSTELARLMKSDPDGKIPLGRVDRSINTKDFPLGRLNAKEHHNYQVTTGAYFRAQMEQAMADPSWKQMDDVEKRKAVKKMGTQARKWAREEVFSMPEENK